MDLKFPQSEHPIFPGRKSVLTFPTLISEGKSINIVPDSCLAFGDARILPGITQEYLEKKIRERFDKLKVKYRLTPVVYVPPSFIKPNELIVKIIQKESREILKREPEAEGAGPWSDMWMFIEKGIPAVNFGYKGEGMHDKNEYVEIKSIIEITKIYVLTAFDFLNFKNI